TGRSRHSRPAHSRRHPGPLRLRWDPRRGGATSDLDLRGGRHPGGVRDTAWNHPRRGCAPHRRARDSPPPPEGVEPMSDLPQLVLNGLMTGSILAIGAVGVTLVLGVLRLLHVAHGDTMA